MAKSVVNYTADNLEAFARAFLVSGDAERAYREVFKTRGAAKNRAAGAVLVGDERVRAHLEAIKAREAAAVLGAVTLEMRAGEMRNKGMQMEIGGEEGGNDDFDPYGELPKMLRRVAYLAEHGESDNVKLKASENYDKLLARHQAHERAEDVPAELVAFLAEIEGERSMRA